ncbi:hypothetical protein Pyn_24563 [Prunus yedoensis var. nudiflora]|uniref:Uncharacterized protein n=1 Tax=Prunus yedoensis var. nudiflora TaxID=2094558 RepID=A0A314YAZ9_PRUYE|nr:hypothetical protein Pyn_24563 [Prunus yedoensis var. nudiflora]
MGGVKQGNVGRQVFWAESWQPRHGNIADLMSLALVLALSTDWDRSCRQAARAGCATGADKICQTDVERSCAQRVSIGASTRLEAEGNYAGAQDAQRTQADRGQFVASG